MSRATPTVQSHRGRCASNWYSSPSLRQGDQVSWFVSMPLPMRCMLGPAKAVRLHDEGDWDGSCSCVATVDSVAGTGGLTSAGVVASVLVGGGTNAGALASSSVTSPSRPAT